MNQGVDGAKDIGQKGLSVFLESSQNVGISYNIGGTWSHEELLLGIIWI